MTNSFTIIQYLRWLKASARRVRDDARGHVYRQGWWAKGVSIAPSVMIRLGANARLEIGYGSTIGPYTILDAQDDPMRGDSATSILSIGERTAINEFNNIRAAGGTITIGSSCIIAQFVSIVAANHSFARDRLIRDQVGETTRNRVCIGDDVWIGAGAIILPGTTVGTGCVIAAGAVVTSDIPAYAIAAGVPATVKKYR